MKDNKNTVLDEQKENKEVWPGRYEVSAMVDYFPYKFGVYKDVWLTLANNDMTSEEAEALLEKIGITPNMENFAYTLSYVYQTFTEEQAEKLIAFLENYKGTKASKTPAKRPGLNPQEFMMGVIALPMGHQQDFHTFSEDEGHNLDFKTSAYYDVRHNVCIRPGEDEATAVKNHMIADLLSSFEYSIQGMDVGALEELKQNSFPTRTIPF